MNSALTEDGTQHVWLSVSEIVADESRNTRCYAEGSGVAVSGSAGVGEELTDDELAGDIRERGLIAPLGVTLTGEEIYRLRWGYRRHRVCAQIDPDMRVPCIVVDETDAWAELSDNLAENLHRKQLRTFEIAEALYRMRRLRPDLPNTSLCEELRISKGYGSQLLSIRENACPELWRLFVQYGTRFSRNVSVRHLYAISKLPPDEQLAAWQKLVAERDNTGRKKRRRGASGLARRSDAMIWLSKTMALPASEEFREGARFALRCVLKMQRWELTDSDRGPTLPPRRAPSPPSPEEHHAADHP